MSDFKINFLGFLIIIIIVIALNLYNLEEVSVVLLIGWILDAAHLNINGFQFLLYCLR